MITQEILEEEIKKELERFHRTVELLQLYQDSIKDLKEFIENKRTNIKNLEYLGGNLSEYYLKIIGLIKANERIKDKYELYRSYFPDQKVDTIEDIINCAEKKLNKNVDLFKKIIKKFPTFYYLCINNLQNQDAS